jgi:pyruvate/2-oxoglutarate dehydrogenase complex dihydrolipoamide dehydrogenase (E3) component
MKTFDAIIIGSGQAGTPLAFKFAAEGKTVAFIEKEHLGGTCLNVGCTPTKAYVASARRMWEAQHGEMMGVNIPAGATADLKKIKERKEEIIRSSVEGIADGLDEKENITLYKGAGKFIGSKEVEVNGERLKADLVFINCGARPVIPEGYENVPCLTSSSILELEEIPEHLVIVGGSYIGLEFGQMFRRFGSRVTIVEKADTIISREDEDVSEAIMEFFKAEGIEFRLQATCMEGNQEEDGSISIQVDCRLGGPPEVRGSHLLMAVGRTPNTDSLNLRSTGLATDDKGYIPVNDSLETKVPGIYALGDCNGHGGFTHTSYNDYEIVAANLFEGKHRKVSDRIMTYGLFVDPPLGRAGMTKKEALKRGIRVLEGYRKMSDIARAREKGETYGFIRVLVDATTDRILGASILGTGGDEVISSILNIMYAGDSYRIIKESMPPHPTVSELIPTILGALEKAELESE